MCGRVMDDDEFAGITAGAGYASNHGISGAGWLHEGSAGRDTTDESQAWGLDTNDFSQREFLPSGSDEMPARRATRRGSRPGGHRGASARSGPRAPRKTVAERLEEGSITSEEAYEKARESVLRTLTAAPKSRGEILASLGRKGYPEHIAESVVARLEDVGLINDSEYADMIVRTRHRERGLARRAISMELRRRGVGDDDAAEALEQVDDDSERDAAERLAAKILRSSTRYPVEVRTRRAVASLARKGYSPGLAYAVVREVLLGEEVEEAELEFVDIE
jgi:regulatory protein